MISYEQQEHLIKCLCSGNQFHDFITSLQKMIVDFLLLYFLLFFLLVL